jgi:hypothetical protein
MAGIWGGRTTPRPNGVAGMPVTPTYFFLFFFFFFLKIKYVMGTFWKKKKNVKMVELQ